MSAENIWLIIGVFMILAEIAGASGAGLLFAGFGAILTGALVNFGVLAPENTMVQIAVFALMSAAFALALWKPLQRWRVGKANKGFNNIIGETAYVSSASLSKLHGGEVSWSGTIMKAVLAADAPVESLESGKAVRITDMNGVTLTVTPID